MLCLGLLLLQEFHNEILVLFDEVVGEPLRPQIVAKVFSPIRIKSLEDGELRWSPATGSVDASRSWSAEGC